MFHRGHYNKIGDLLARRVVVEEWADKEDFTKDRQKVVHRITAAFVVMFEEDNSKFDQDKFLNFVTEKAEEYRENLRSSP